MSTYTERAIALQSKFNNFYALLNLYKISRLNNGWTGSETVFASKTLESFRTYFTDNSIVKPSAAISASFYDLPMMVRSYNKDGIYSSGAPSDIGFTHNIEKIYDVDQTVLGNKIHHALYTVINSSSTVSYVSNDANSSKLLYTIIQSNNEINLYPNEDLSKKITVPIDCINWKYTDKFIIKQSDNSNHMHMLHCIASLNKNHGGLLLYVTTNFMTWNIHQIIPENITNAQWEYLLGTSITELSASDENAELFQSILEKYFRILPNNNYIIMYPVSMLTGGDTSTMVTMYSPFNENPIAKIKDPNYETNTSEICANKAKFGISSYLTETGEVILYYNSISDIGLILYNGRTMGTYTSSVYSSYKNEIVEYPKIAKFYGIPTSATEGRTFEAASMVMDCGISILEPKNGKIDEIPAMSVSIAMGDTAKKIESGDSDLTNAYDNISLFINNAISYMNNIDADFSDYIYTEAMDSENFRNGIIPIDLGLWRLNYNNINIYNNSKVFIRGARSGYSDNIVYRATMLGNTIYNDVNKFTNNPSLGSNY